MRRLLTPTLIVLISAICHPARAQSGIRSADGTLAGTREFGIFAAGRVLSTEYSVPDAKTAFGAAAFFATHVRSAVAVQGGLAMSYGRQLNSYYKPPLFTFTPTISVLLQRPSTSGFQPYGIVGAGYEFVRFTHPRCDCDQSRSFGVGNLGLGVRKMMGSTRAFRAEVSSQIGSGGPAFTGMAGMSFIVGTPDRFAKQRRMRLPEVKKEPPTIPPPDKVAAQPPANRPATTGPARTPAPVTAPSAAPAPPTVNRPPAPSALPTGVGAVLLQIDGTQVDFTKPAWRDEAESMLDGLLVDLTSDAGQKIKISIEAHTDNVGSNAGNIMLGLDRARAVRDYLVTQGVATSRIRISSAGEDSPIAPNNTAIGRQLNRRIIIRRDN
ncbi:MAG TPA: OmpA family protein [Gemmatimonadaceae bacterium]|nr:OmpA family protein [Gemmatimonadaceae bacterium]